MSKILFTYPTAISMSLISVALSGCLGQLLEQDFRYVLHIQNKTATSIAHCSERLASACPFIVKSGETGYVPFTGYLNQTTEQGKNQAFDDYKVKLCGKLIGVGEIRKTSSITKRDDRNYDIVIDQSVADKFCK